MTIANARCLGRVLESHYSLVEYQKFSLAIRGYHLTQLSRINSPPPCRHTLNIIRMSQKILATRERVLASLRPALLLVQRELDALVVDAIFAYLIRHLDARPAHAHSQATPRIYALVLDELAKLPQALQECHHGSVELSMQEAEVDGEVAG